MDKTDNHHYAQDFMPPQEAGGGGGGGAENLTSDSLHCIMLIETHEKTKRVYTS